MEPVAVGGGYVEDGFEISLALGALAFVVMLLGPGRWSLDYLIGLVPQRTRRTDAPT